MTRHSLLAVAALAVVLLGAGCGDRDAPPLPEMEEPFYVQGVQSNKQGRNGEALTSFLKVIDKRGERGAPESHLEAGVIYLNHTKDPVLAYYHFKRYLELQANSKEAPRVRGMLDAAFRDIARRLPGRPAEDQSVRLAAAEEITKLRRENDELRAELQTLRGGGASFAANNGRMVSMRDPRIAPTVQPDIPIVDTSIVPAPSPNRPVPTTQATTLPPAAPMAKQAATRPTQPTTRPLPAGRMHTVRQSEGLFAIARQFDAKNPGKKMRDIVDANPDVLPDGVNTPLRPGMTLRIP